VPVPAAGAGTERDLPLTGVTILDFGLMFASPYGASMLSDLGARVIKIETLAGDTIRRVCPFPESGAAKVMQGKESIAVDLATEQGREIITELVKRADVVLQSFRAGAAGRVGIDAASVAAINPAAVYVSAPGYGTDGPDARRPAYAPSIGAAIGLSLTDAPDAATATSTLAEVKRASVRLFQAAAVPSAQADGLAALGVASAILLGLLARKRGAALGALTTTMLGTGALALLDQVIDYPGRPSSPCGDPDGMGYHALYRMYPAADGWVFLAAPAEKEWGELVSALADDIALGADDRFGTAEARRANDKALADALAGAFAKRPAQEWEDRLTAADVGCVVVTEKMPEVLLQTDAALAATYATTAMSPVFDEHLRLAPAVRFSRSRTRALGGCLAGDHTDAILREIGYVDDAIADLHDRKIVG
jgi:crotonobetainyl-CoA:carnitine CoA-transferase CaiB-like acyl-CoA transferase